MLRKGEIIISTNCHMSLYGIIKHKEIVHTNQQPSQLWPPNSVISYFDNGFYVETRVVIHADDIKLTSDWLPYFSTCH